MADVVEVWLVREGLPPGLALAELYAVLDARERQRADDLLREADRNRFVVAHAAVRFVVGGWLGAPPAELRWEYGPHGKPALGGSWRGVQVNLSHSGGLCLVAVTRSRRVGVDIQRLEPGLDVVAMARRYFTPLESRFVQDPSDGDERAERFVRLWTRKEAVTKAAGGRLIRHGMAVPVQGVGGAVVDFPDEADAGPYRVTDVSAPDGYRAAVALSGPEHFQVESRECGWDWDRDWAGSSARMSPKSRATPAFSDGTETGTPGS